MLTSTCDITVYGVLVKFGFLGFEDDVDFCCAVWPDVPFL